jgi:hypothetical protein
MFPDGNIVVEMSKFNENVPAWELLVVRVGLDARKSLIGYIAAKGKAAKRNARAREPVLFRRSGRISKARLSVDLSRAGPRRAKAKKTCEMTSRGALVVPQPFLTTICIR